MARITVEDCKKKVNSRFALVNLAIRRVLQLRKGARPLLETDNKEVVCALREIAAGKVTLENIDQLEAAIPGGRAVIASRYEDQSLIMESFKEDTDRFSGERNFEQETTPDENS